ncbi:hypothetical protein D9M69_601510 [compost metagenome]
MVHRVVGFYRQKCARTDVQRHEMLFDTAFADFFEQIGCEMQPGSWCCDSTFFPCINSLIIAAVAFIFSALGCDIRRQRNMADGGNRFIKHSTRKVENQQHLARIAFLGNGCIERAHEAA